MAPWTELPTPRIIQLSEYQASAQRVIHHRGDWQRFLVGMIDKERQGLEELEFRVDSEELAAHNSFLGRWRREWVNGVGTRKKKRRLKKRRVTNTHEEKSGV